MTYSSVRPTQSNIRYIFFSLGFIVLVGSVIYSIHNKSVSISNVRQNVDCSVHFTAKNRTAYDELVEVVVNINAPQTQYRPGRLLDSKKMQISVPAESEQEYNTPMKCSSATAVVEVFQQ